MITFALLVATIKVKTFWEDHEIWKKNSYLFECYWVNVKTIGRFCGLLRKPQLYVPRGWVPKFATGVYIIIKNEFIFNFLTRLDYKHKN